MGLLHGGLERQFVLQIAQDSAMVFRQYRVPSHSSSQPAHSQLQPRKMPSGRAAVSNRETGDTVRQFQIINLSSVGRAAAQIGGVPGGEKPGARSGPPGLAVYRQAVLRAGKPSPLRNLTCVRALD